jgi:hypothetical protein
MTGHTIILGGAASRALAKRLIDAAPMNAVCKVKKEVRTVPQNEKMWSMLTDLAIAKPMGILETPDGWKCLAMHACGHEVQFMQGLDGRPFPIGFRSSKLDKEQMSNLIDWLHAFAAENNVKLNERESA